MKEISKREIDKLVNNKYIYNTNRGYIGKDGFSVGFYRTKTKRYIEDKYADIAAKLT